MGNVLVVIGNSSPTSGDQAIIDRLDDVLGHNVDTRIDDDPADGTSAYDLVIFAESSSSGEVNKYSGITVPAMVCEGGSWAAFGFSASFHTQSNVTQWNLPSQSTVEHGQGTGSKTVFTSGASQHYARISDEVCDGATVVATVAGQSDYAAVFVVDEGGDLVSGTSPARRAAYGLHNSAAATSTSDQWAVFDAVVSWLLGDDDGGDEEPPEHDTVRMYFTNYAPDTTPDDSPMSRWFDPDGYVVKALRNAPAGAPGEAALGENRNVVTYILLGQWISGPANSSGYIPANAAWQFVMAACAHQADADLRWGATAWLMDSNGERKAELFDTYWPGYEWPTPENITATLQPVSGGLPTSDVPVSPGDRIVVELGFRAGNTSTEVKAGSIVYGGNAAADLEQGNTGSLVTSRPSWIDIPVSDGLTFGHVTETQKLYLTDVVEEDAPTWAGTIWVQRHDDAIDEQFKMLPTNESTMQSRSITETSSESGRALLVARFVSPPLSDDAYLDGDILLGIARQVSNENAQFKTMLRLTVMAPDGSSAGVAESWVGGSAATESQLGYRLSGRTVQPRPLVAGSRIIAEVGFRADNSSSTSYTGTLWYGGTGADIAHNSSEITGAKFLELDITKGVTFEGEDDGDDDEDPGLPPQNRRPANPGEALWIGDDPGKNHFNVGIGQGNAGVSGDTNHLDWDQDEIEGGFYSPDRFYLVEEGEHTWVRFKINAGAGRTSSGTQYPRSELRELEPDGDRIGWDGRSGWHRMKGISRVSQVTPVRPWVCFFQIHDASSDLIRVQTEGDPGQTTGLKLRARWTPPGGSDDQTTLPGWDGTYDVGDVLAWEIWIGGPTSADDGRCRIWINESLVLDLEDMGADGCYFKAGCYLQSNTHTRGEDPDDTASADILAGSFQVWHTGYPEPTEPVFTGPWIDGPPVNTTRFFLAG